MDCRKLSFVVATACACGPSVEGTDAWPDWQGERLGYWDADIEGGLHVVDVGTGEHAILDLPSHQPSPRWSFAARGDVVVVETRGSWYESFDVETGEPLGLVSGDDCNRMFGLAADPFGDTVALARVSGPCGATIPTTLTVHTFEPNPGGNWGARDLFTSPGEITEFTWAPAARVLAVVHTLAPDRWLLTRVDADTGASIDLFESRWPLTLPRLSPDGSVWAVVEDDIVHMPTWHEQLDFDVLDLAWHPERDEIFALSDGGSSWVLQPVAERSDFNTFHPADTILIGWPHDGDGEPLLRGCGDGGLNMRGTIDGSACIYDVRSVTRSPTQDLLLVATDEILVSDGRSEARGLGSGFVPQWAR